MIYITFIDVINMHCHYPCARTRNKSRYRHIKILTKSDRMTPDIVQQ